MIHSRAKGKAKKEKHLCRLLRRKIGEIGQLSSRTHLPKSECLDAIKLCILCAQLAAFLIPDLRFQAEILIFEK